MKRLLLLLPLLLWHLHLAKAWRFSESIAITNSANTGLSDDTLTEKATSRQQLFQD